MVLHKIIFKKPIAHLKVIMELMAKCLWCGLWCVCVVYMCGVYVCGVICMCGVYVWCCCVVVVVVVAVIVEATV